MLVKSALLNLEVQRCFARCLPSCPPLLPSLARPGIHSLNVSSSQRSYARRLQSFRRFSPFPLSSDFSWLFCLSCTCFSLGLFYPHFLFAFHQFHKHRIFLTHALFSFLFFCKGLRHSLVSKFNSLFLIRGVTFEGLCWVYSWNVCSGVSSHSEKVNIRSDLLEVVFILWFELWAILIFIDTLWSWTWKAPRSLFLFL